MENLAISHFITSNYNYVSMWFAFIFAFLVLIVQRIEAAQINYSTNNSSGINVVDHLQIKYHNEQLMLLQQPRGADLAPLNASHASRRRRSLAAVRRGRALNAIDRCWRVDKKWARNRKKLASCALGFATGTTGGKSGRFYVVTNAGDDAQNPWPGTLRYGVIQERPLWIVFARDMTIVLQKELIFTSDKTVDGRGVDVHIAYGPCLTIQYVRNVIIHGLSIHDCRPGSAGLVRSSTSHIGYRLGTEGDGITVFGSRRIWIDHNSLWSCADGLVDVVSASTAVTISNNYFAYHDKVMLLGHSDEFSGDKIMRVTVAFNHFGPGLTERMPRCRFGYCHVVNNDYDGWGDYAIGGSASPTILSQGNRFKANWQRKEVTKREGWGSSSNWKWRSISDTFMNGAYFVQSGGPINGWNRFGLSANTYTPSMTSTSGVLKCRKSSIC